MPLKVAASMRLGMMNGVPLCSKVASQPINAPIKEVLAISRALALPPSARK